MLKKETNIVRWIFHGSSIDNLQVINPSVSLHGQAYVYGVLNKNDALWYCADFKGFHQLLDDHKLIDDRKLKMHFAGKSGYIYMLEKTNFEYDSNIQHWISPVSVNVINCEKIEDIYEKMASIPNFFNIKLEKINGEA